MSSQGGAVADASPYRGSILPSVMELGPAPAAGLIGRAHSPLRGPRRGRRAADHELRPQGHVLGLPSRPLETFVDRLDGQPRHLRDVLTDGGEVDTGERGEA